jgi:hypothetical protein
MSNSHSQNQKLDFFNNIIVFFIYNHYLYGNGLNVYENELDWIGEKLNIFCKILIIKTLQKLARLWFKSFTSNNLIIYKT